MLGSKTRVAWPHEQGGAPQGARELSTRDRGEVEDSQYGKLAGLHPEDRPQGEAEHKAGQGGNIAASEY